MDSSPAIAATDVLIGSPVQRVLRKIFSFPVFLSVLLIAGIFVGIRKTPPDPDTWWHIAVGQQILQQRSWPTTESYSFTASGTSWMAYEWLGEVLMAGAERLGGLQGRTALMMLLSGTLFLLLYYYSYLRSGNIKAAFLACTVALPAAGVFFTLRPQLLGYVFLLTTLICLERFRQGRQGSLWILPAVFLLWVNTHGSFAFGFLALGIYWASGLVDFRVGGLVAEPLTHTQRRHLALTFLLSLVALTMTPYGTRLAAYPLEMALFQPINIASIQEWQPLGPDLLLGTLFLGLLLLLFIGQLLRGPRFRLEEVALLLITAVAASIHRRFLLLFILVSVPVLAKMLAQWVPVYNPAKNRPVLNAAIIFSILVSLFAFFPSKDDLQQMVSRNYPQAAVEYMLQNPINGPMLNEYGWGGYLIWRLGPQHKVFIDGRADVYEYSGVLSDYVNLTQLKPGALSILSKYGVQSCLLQRDSPLAVVLAALPGWDRIYTDSVSSLFVVKRSGQMPDHAAGGRI